MKAITFIALLLLSLIKLPLSICNINKPKEVINILDYGAKGDGMQDDTSFIQKAFDDVSRDTKSVIFPRGTYVISRPLQLKYSSKIIMDGKNSTFLIQPNARKGFSVFNFSGVQTSSELDFINFTIDGKLTQQNQWDETNFQNCKIYYGVTITSGNCNVSNSKIMNFWGTALTFSNFNTAKIENSEITNVGGHWYQNNEHDAFGDAIYIGDRNTDCTVLIDNVKASGKSSNGKLSRIGLTIENFNKHSKSGTTTINITNSTIINYERGVHAEGNNIPINISIEKSTISGRVIFLGISNLIKPLAIVKSSNISFYPGNYNGTFGLSRNFKIQADSCIINNTGSGQAMGDSGTEALFSNCTFNHMKDTYATNAKIKIINSSVNSAEKSQKPFFWKSETSFINTKMGK